MRRVTGLLALSICVLAPARALAAQGTAAADSALRVVQAFYSWYVPMAAEDADDPAWMRAIRERGALFSRELIDGLRADSVARAKDPDEVVGLDGDPFLDAQDPCDSYHVRRARPSGDNWLVEVLGSGGCETHNTPDVVVEVARRDGRWVFVNFRDPGPPPRDLLGTLQRERATSSSP